MLIVDATHLRATLTGLERITLDLFSPEALAPLPVTVVTARGLKGMVAAQQARLPWELLRQPRSLLLCPGFPAAPALYPFRRRVLPYIHDIFLATRWADLNARARLYMSGPFRLMVSSYPAFLVNSEATRDALRGLCRPDAEIALYRPAVGNVFGVTPRPDRPAVPGGTLRLVALGTVEPRKNYAAAAALVRLLRARGCDATLDVIGRRGWGPDWAVLEAEPGVTLRGYCSPEEVRSTLEGADVFLSTSHEEGLGLPLLEAQHAGLEVVAPAIPVFREVLGASGLLYDPARLDDAADRLLAATAEPGWRSRAAAAADANLRRWNEAAGRDRRDVMLLLVRRLEALRRGP